MTSNVTSEVYNDYLYHRLVYMAKSVIDNKNDEKKLETFNTLKNKFKEILGTNYINYITEKSNDLDKEIQSLLLS